MAKCLTVLGIETSCDETAASVVTLAASGPELLSSIVLSQVADHAIFGGVVPEIAARAHITHLDGIIKKAMDEAGIEFGQLDGIAVTSGPGLAGGLLVGMMTAKAICLVRGIPFIAINHLEGHALTPGLSDGINPPYLLLLVSGGHTQIVMVEAYGHYQRLGTTIDDALGEAFDKTAKLLNLGYPGGPAVEKKAKTGNPDRFDFPRPLKGQPGCNFSFSGLKTAVRQQAERLDPLTDRDVADICACFQAAVCDCLTDRLERAMNAFADTGKDLPQKILVAAGGVAANQAIRTRLDSLARQNGYRLITPPLGMCTDNAAMIAWAGIKRLQYASPDSLDFAPRPRWPLDEDAPPAPFAGAKA